MKGEPAAVSGRANLVRDADTTLAREASSETVVDARDAPRGGFKALASLLAVGSGGGRRSKALNSATTGCRDGSTRLEVRDARSKLACHLTTCYGSLGNGCNHHHAHKHHTNQLKSHKASHD